jgi:hypothetical protein
MSSKKGQVTASPSVKLLLPTGLVSLLALKAPPQLDEGGRGGPHQEDWARKTVVVTGATTKRGTMAYHQKLAINGRRW